MSAVPGISEDDYGLNEGLEDQKEGKVKQGLFVIRNIYFLLVL